VCVCVCVCVCVGVRIFYRTTYNRKTLVEKDAHGKKVTIYGHPIKNTAALAILFRVTGVNFFLL
jgi:hypothetical protein